MSLPGMQLRASTPAAACSPAIAAAQPRQCRRPCACAASSAARVQPCSSSPSALLLRSTLGASGAHHHRSRLQPVCARRRSPVIAPDIQIGQGEDQMFMDLMNYLLRQRIIFLSGYVNDKLATQVVGSLLALEAMDEEEDIRLYINSPGGQPYSVIGIVDTLCSIKPQVQTYALGAVYSYSSLILAAGAKGKRYSMKNTRIMMTQPMGGSQGDIYQISATVKELNAIYQLMAKYYMRFTGMTADEVEMNTCRDFFMTPEDAQDWGLIDDVIRGDGDYTAPPSLVASLREAGLVDDLTGGVLKTGRSFTTL